MGRFESYENGQFCWIDLQSKNVDQSKRFYGGLFGWDFVDNPIPGIEGASYTHCLLRGEQVAGIGSMQAEMKAAGMPAVWTPYAWHDDVRSIAPRVEEAGGRVLMPPGSVGEDGDLALFTDPTGAAFGVWQPGKHRGAGLANEPNTFVWNDLNTREPEKAKPFYEEVFGWTWKDSGPTYWELQLAGRSVGGMMKMGEDFPNEVPSHWSIYFGAKDLEASLARVKELGGAVHMPPRNIDNVGDFSVVADPQGGTFLLIQLTEWPG